MDADIHNPSQGYRFCVDGVHETNIAEWNKKRKLQSDELDLPRPKHKCWLGNSSSEHASMFEENRALESMQIYVLEDRTGADSSEPESAKDSNSFTEDSNTAMSVNEEGKLVADSAKTYLYGGPSTSLVSWDGYNVKDNHCSLDVSADEKGCSGEADTFVDKECNPSYHYADIQALKNLEEQILELENRSNHVCQEYAEDVDMEFEDFLFAQGGNRNMYVLSSGRWSVNQEFSGHNSYVDMN
ncbi:uncharacterized protein LOC113850435 isoform X2 [Abrus precatorius]|uniref:Uncharacterized protein LOC113850435 isoform X2 n=1 Tax=Abrus precatorius TaxID=3816 RepID=A0A8B8JZ49_ABRPR|nr:uncharacterized protein LOC113850435 isoform X2 [Abrus precatorius]